MDRLHELEVFAAVAEVGSFARAGTRLRLSPPAVTRAIAALEERLGARVFNRTTRSLAITDVGRLFLERARRILADLDAAEKEAVGQIAVPQGHLTVTAPVTLGRSVVAPIVRAFLAAHPRTTVALLLLDRITNLIDEGIDAAIRIGPLPDSNLMVKRIGSVQRVLVASPRYLGMCGTPKSLGDLRKHAVIAFTGLGASREWRFSDAGRARSITVEPRLEINDAMAAVAAAEGGEGITLVVSYMVAAKLRKGKLVTILDEVMPTPVPVHLVHTQSQMIVPKLRAFVDFAAPRLKQDMDALSVPVAAK